MEPLGRRKRALDEGDERRDVASESDSVSPRLVDARRVTGAVKSRRLNEDLRPPNAAFGGKLRPGTASFSSGEASGRPSATGAPFANPFETKKAPPSVPRPIFTLPGQKDQSVVATEKARWFHLGDGRRDIANSSSGTEDESIVAGANGKASVVESNGRCT
ncbi:hypothetical protein PHYBOEH_010626 [Phytophthora boehmeriae]|uniref:Uncharacterized protein n=1 Tax=Phytophthora boehmeriae TaxID=109152 RepID=A0A8T1WYZ8_9STRA|nr:hypothetical protein PHYBOEH_010626 [Phytophthora boehmeriae]